MAGWCGARYGVVAGAVARVYVRCAARVMGAGLRSIGRSLRPALHTARKLAQGLWLARHADPGRSAGAGVCMDPDVREGAGSLGREQANSEHDPTASLAAAVRHLQAE